MNWTLAVTGGALVVMVGRSVRSHAASESPCLLPSMAVLPVAPVLLLRAGRLHPAMVPMGFAARSSSACARSFPTRRASISVADRCPLREFPHDRAARAHLVDMRYLLLPPAGILLLWSVFSFFAAEEASDPGDVLGWKLVCVAFASFVLLGTRWLWRRASPAREA